MVKYGWRPGWSGVPPRPFVHGQEDVEFDPDLEQVIEQGGKVVSRPGRGWFGCSSHDSAGN